MLNYISYVGIGLFAVIINCILVISIYNTNKILLLSEVTFKRLELYCRKEAEGQKTFEERIINFYEYVAFLVINNKLPKKLTKDLFFSDYKNLLKFHKKTIEDNNSWKDIKTLMVKWQID